ncbi:hypothetical protein FSP39_011343 [Pinctada imbricata]|uniref:C2H2-type domain-containing protein n=1 Tax=Pinctada imbricata TaxID=66713 RepID=A0AA88Y908_PINIB|nr:hypothetical protein FSP39_011343 [Pinctada imbricata]
MASDNGRYIHHKKRKILEAAQQEHQAENGHEEKISESYNQYVNGENDESQADSSSNYSDQAASYAHKKLRKEVFENKDAVHEKVPSYDDHFPTSNSDNSIPSNYKTDNQPFEAVNGQHYSETNKTSENNERPKASVYDVHFGTNEKSEPNYRPPELPNISPLPQHPFPSYPAINMNMYGNFAMPLNVPHPMMYMNPNMFVPPVNNGMMPHNNVPLNAQPDQFSQRPEIPQPHIPTTPPEPPQKSNGGASKKQQHKEEKCSSSVEEEKTNVVEIYECKICSRRFSQVGNFHNHMKLHSEKVCVCGICKLECADSYELQRHMRTTHTGNMPYKCNECDREFSQYNNLRRHLRVHSGKSYKCHICGRTFNEIFYLEMHIGSHTGERTYKCGVCNLTFRDNADLQKHVKTHKAEELHTCDVCGKSFSKACVLRQHKKMHLGIRPYKCEVCSKAFIHRHHLTIHMRMHTSSKPYACKLCKKEFTQTSHLYKHLRQHAVSLGTDISLDLRNDSSPTVAEIEEIFEKIQASNVGNAIQMNSDNFDSSSQDSIDKEVAEFTENTENQLSKFHKKSYSVSSGETTNDDSVKNSTALTRYSPISSASSQCDSQSDAGSIDVVNTVDSPNAQEIQEIMKSSENVSTPGTEIQRLTKSTESSNASTNTPPKEDNVLDKHSLLEDHASSKFNVSNSLDKNDKLYRSDGLSNFALKVEQCDLPLMDVEGRVADVDAVAAESSSDKTASTSGKSASPCSSLSSRSDYSHADCTQQRPTFRDRSRTNSFGSPSEDESGHTKTPSKQRGRRRNVAKQKPKKESEFGNAMPETAFNGQMPVRPPPLQSNPPQMSSDMQNLYLMQLQQLQSLQMAFFANAMMTQSGIPGVANGALPAMAGVPGSPAYNVSPLGMMASPTVRNSPLPLHTMSRSPHVMHTDRVPSRGIETLDRSGAVDLRVEKA